MRFNFITLGCSKNLVDSEVLATYLKKNNIQIAFEDEPQKDDIIVINTCGFINDAKQESIDTILQFIEEKNRGNVKKVYVIGCLSQRYKEDLRKEIPEVDEFFGVNLSEILNHFKIDYKKELFGERLISTPKHYAYLKISEGCNRKCSFCAIPLIRGKHISVEENLLLQQAEYLASKGVKELILIAQDTSYYGVDLYGKHYFANLLENLAKKDLFPWIRIHYLYPIPYLEEIFKQMAQFSNVCKYVDIPFQHISDKILNSMRRGHDSKFVYKIIELIKKYLPEAAIRSTFIVGYPGETEEDFKQLVEFTQNVKFDRLGVFTYSPEENTYAYSLGDPIDDDIKQKRMEIIMDIQQKISLDKNLKKINNVYKVLIDRKEADYFVGRTEFDSPDIDNEVLIYRDDLKIGEFYDVKIIDAFEFDLIGEVIE